MALVVLTMSPVFLLLVTSSSRERTRAAETAQATMRMDAEATARQIETAVIESHRGLATLAAVPSVRETPQDACMLLSEASRIDARYVSMALVDTEGRYVCQTLEGSFEDITVADRAWVRVPLDEGLPHNETIRQGRVSGRSVLVVSHPVRGSSGEVNAVVAAGLDLRRLIEAEHGPHLSPTISVVAPDGVLAVHGNPDLSVDQADLLPFFAADAPEWHISTGEGARGRIGAIVRVQGVDGIGVAAFAAESELIGPLRADFRRNLIVLIVVTSLSLLAAWLAAHRLIARPLEQIAVAARSLAGGDLDARARLTRGSDELKTLASTFDQMAEALHDRELEAKRARTELNETHQRLAHSQKMEAVGQLTGGVAHDFNNLLTVVKGCLGLIDTRQLSEEDHQLIAEALLASERGVELTARLLAFSRRQALSPRRIDLNELAVSMRPILTRTLGEHIKIVFELTEPSPKCVADPHQVESVLLNLAVNARDAMPDGGQITIRTGWLDTAEEPVPDLAPGRYAVLRVSDEGVGMPPEVVARAVEPFFTTKDRGRGTGLGLSGAYGFAQQSGGTLAIDSQEGVGTNVHLFLPATERPTDSPGTRSTTSAVGMPQPA